MTLVVKKRHTIFTSTSRKEDGHARRARLPSSLERIARCRKAAGATRGLRERFQRAAATAAACLRGCERLLPAAELPAAPLLLTACLLPLAMAS